MSFVMYTVGPVVIMMKLGGISDTVPPQSTGGTGTSECGGIHNTIEQCVCLEGGMMIVGQVWYAMKLLPCLWTICKILYHRN